MDQPETNNDTSQDRQLGRNFVWMTWSGMVSIANSVLVWIFLARMRDVDDVGRFTIVMGLYALFFGIVSLGLMPYITNEVARRSLGSKDPTLDIRGFLSSTSVFLLLSGVLSAALMTLSGVLVSGSASVRSAALALSLALIPTTLITISEATALALGRARLVAIVTSIENILRTIIPIGLLWYGYDIVEICISFTAVRFIALIAYMLVARVRVEHFSFVTNEFRKLASVCPTFAGTIIFSSLNWQAALILLGYFSTEAESGKYGVASRFLIPVTILMASYSGVIQPAIARVLDKTPENIGAYMGKIIRLPLFTAVGVAILSPLLSPSVLSLMFGAEYADAAPTLDILAVAMIPFCVVIVAARGLVATGSQHIDLIANVIGVVVCFGTGLLLIPQYGALGAATAQLLSFMSMALIELIYLSKKASGFSIWRTA
ncbi:MAG: polysaccharide biosynthesis C-terminal domain-containing protein [Pyrinomonadaceae bacterium]